MDIVIEGNLFIDGEIKKGCVGIDEGRIVSIKKILEGENHFDFGEKLIFPAGLDVHVHFREPGQTEKEDFFTGTRAAAMGGITFVMDMPNNKPPAMNVPSLERKIKTVKNKACIDFALYGGIGEDSDIPAMAQKCKAFKMYLSGDNEMFVPIGKMEYVLQKVKESGRILAVHAESPDCIKRNEARNLSEHERNRPVRCEIEEIKKIMEINRGVGTKIHICHVSSSRSIDVLKGSGASMGVTPHHIFFSTSSKFRYEAMGKVNPPLRHEEERMKLFESVRHGFDGIIESDHAPHLLDEKENFLTAPSGMPGVDTSLPLMMEEVKRERMSLSMVHRMMCVNPARTFGINKGAIEAGRDADLLVIDFRESEIKSYSKCGWSAYEKRKGIYPSHVFLRGEMIVENGEFAGGEGMGEMIS